MDDQVDSATLGHIVRDWHRAVRHHDATDEHIADVRLNRRIRAELTEDRHQTREDRRELVGAWYEARGAGWDDPRDFRDGRRDLAVANHQRAQIHRIARDLHHLWPLFTDHTAAPEDYAEKARILDVLDRQAERELARSRRERAEDRRELVEDRWR